MNIITAKDYLQSDVKSRDLISLDIEQLLGDHFKAISSNSNESGLPRFQHMSTGIYFRFILPGTFQMGLSTEEEWGLKKLSKLPRIDISSMRPVHEENVGPFLVSERPVLVREYTTLAGPFARSKDLPDDYPAYVMRDEAEALSSRFGFRFPTEAEWEYVCRATTTSLFVWGNHLPSDEELNRWMRIDFDQSAHMASNLFGMCGLFTETWCVDRYRENYSSPSSSSSDYVLRGGGSYFWPWQDEEWVWCISANRFPSSMLDDDTCGLFLACDIAEL